MEVLASARLSFRRCTAIASSGLIAALVVLGALWPSVAGAGAGAPAGAAAACTRSATRPRNRAACSRSARACQTTATAATASTTTNRLQRFTATVLSLFQHEACAIGQAALAAGVQPQIENLGAQLRQRHRHAVR